MPVGLGCLSTAEVAESPGGVSQHTKLAAVTEEGEKGRESSGGQDVVPALRRITSNVAQSPHSLFPDIGFVAGQQLDKDGDGASLNDDLRLRGRTRGNVGQSPSSLELNEGVRRAQELDETGDDTAFNHLLDGRVALL